MNSCFTAEFAAKFSLAHLHGLTENVDSLDHIIWCHLSTVRTILVLWMFTNTRSFILITADEKDGRTDLLLPYSICSLVRLILLSQMQFAALLNFFPFYKSENSLRMSYHWIFVFNNTTFWGIKPSFLIAVQTPAVTVRRYSYLVENLSGGHNILATQCTATN